jgi:putative aminopeptidase FrvX
MTAMDHPRTLQPWHSTLVPTFLLACVLFACGEAAAQPLPERFVNLVTTPGIAGYEASVRDAVRAQLPAWAVPRTDELGNLILTFGSGAPHVALVAALDESGYVVSRITDDGFLRLHRHTAAVSHRLGDQYFSGQPVVVRASNGRLVPGVTATPSVHFDGFVKPSELARVLGIEDLWVDVGASGAADVARLGIRMLDPVSLRERVQLLAGGRVAGVAAQARAGAQALVEIVRGFANAPPVRHTVTLAWIAQTEFGSRGLVRLAQQIRPDRVYLAGPAVAREFPPGWEEAQIDVKPVPVRFAETPVEVVDTRDIATLGRELATLAGLPPTSASATDSVALTTATAPASRQSTGRSDTLAVMQAFVEMHGVAGHEAAVREAVVKHLPSWAKPETDENGNLTVTFGSGGHELLFVAHMDEVGFEIAGIRDDGSAAVRMRGGLFLSLYEAHPVVVQTPRGPVRAVFAPREDYLTANAAQPDIDRLSLYFGTSSPAETRALGIAEGQPVSIGKQFVPLAGDRVTGMSLDDRAGLSALILALRQIDPSRVQNRVTFAWTVEEETSLAGARALAARLRPQYVFAVDTFVSSEAPLAPQHLAHAALGAGPVLRGIDTRTLVPSETIDRIVTLARAAGVQLQVGVTQGATDASVFSAHGAIDIGLSWPGRYSHSPVEVMDRRDLEGLVRLIATLAQRF